MHLTILFPASNLESEICMIFFSSTSTYIYKSTQRFHFENLFDVDPAPSDIVAILMGEVLGDVGNKEVSACQFF